MITEREIAGKFSAIWRQSFPLLTANFMRVFNETQIQEINKNSIPMSDNIRYDFIAELAFNLSDTLFGKNIITEQYLTKTPIIQDIISKTASSIWELGSYSADDLILNANEIQSIILLSSNILEFIEKLRLNEHEFRPKLMGYGIIPDLSADLSIDNTLYEFKTVNRNFKSSDLKQLFIYLALQQVKGDMKWKYGGLYNPRRGVYCKFNVRNLVYNLSGGKSSNEVFDNLLNGLTRDIQIDSKF